MRLDDNIIEEIIKSYLYECDAVQRVEALKLSNGKRDSRKRYVRRTIKRRKRSQNPLLDIQLAGLF